MASEIPSLLCQSFQAGLYLEFGNVQIGSTNTKLFKLQNPFTNRSVVVSIDKVPDKKGFCVTLGDDHNQSIEIEPNGYSFAHVLWCPSKDMAIRETAHLKVDNKPILQIILHGTAGIGNNKVRSIPLLNLMMSI